MQRTPTEANSFCRWDKNWIIHLDGLFQTTDRKGDYDVHVAKGLRRMVIFDTMKDVDVDFRGIFCLLIGFQLILLC